MSPPRIGITGTTRTFDGALRSGVNAAYVGATLRAGGIPLILPPVIPPEHAAAVAESLDGVLFSGGEDVHPDRYQSEPHARLGTVDPDRDAFELALFSAAWERGLPILAICRGIQLINVALGGSLWQDIPSERGAALPHSPSAARDQRTHPVAIAPDSRLARAMGRHQCEVNSFHHQSLRQLAPGLRITARAPDGEIEGVESAPDAPWLLAVQWHPEEFHREVDAPDHGLFAALIEAATARVPSS